MAITFQIPLDIPDVELLGTEVDVQGMLLVNVRKHVNQHPLSALQSGTKSFTPSADSRPKSLYRAALPQVLSMFPLRK